MEDEELFRELSVRAEKQSVENLNRFKLHVTGLILLGYAYLFAIFMCSITLLYLIIGAAMVERMFLIFAPFPLSVAWVICKALFVKAPPPTGIEITERQAPGSFAMIRDLRREFGSLVINKVLITLDFNAGVTQVPRFGIFGWPKTYLLFGWPLISYLSIEQFRVVLAHELAHVSSRHDRFSAYVFRTRETWARIQKSFSPKDSPFGNFILGRFLKWYAPRFNAYTLVLNRAHEYEADQRSSEVTDQELSAGTLLQLEVMRRAFEERRTAYLREQMEKMSDPPADYVPMIERWSKEDLPEEKIALWLKQATETRENFAATHPRLADRVGQITGDPGSFVDKLVLTRHDPASSLLGDSASWVVPKLNEAWVETVLPFWRAEHEKISNRKNALLNYESIPRQEMQFGDLVNEVLLAAEFRGTTAARKLAEKILERFPDNGVARLLYGRILLQSGDAEGVDHVIAAIGAQPSLEESGAELLLQHFQAIGQEDRAEEYRATLKEAARVRQLTQQERQGLIGAWNFVPHGLDDAVILAIRAQLYELDCVAEVYIARRDVEHLPEFPCWLVLIVKRTPRFGGALQNNVVISRVGREVKWPAEVYLKIISGLRESLYAEIRAVPGSELLSWRLPAPPPPLEGEPEHLATLRAETFERLKRDHIWERREPWVYLGFFGLLAAIMGVVVVIASKSPL
jgi:hypothetical protein